MHIGLIFHIINNIANKEILYVKYADDAEFMSMTKEEIVPYLNKYILEKFEEGDEDEGEDRSSDYPCIDFSQFDDLELVKHISEDFYVITL